MLIFRECFKLGENEPWRCKKIFKKCNLTLAMSPLCNSISPLPIHLLNITVISDVVQTPWF